VTTEVATKRTIHDLAVFTGRPAFPRPVHVGTPNLGDPDAFLESARDILDRRWLSNDGPYAAELERRVADLTGVVHCVAVCNGTLALELVARATGLEGEVIVPAFTFVATAHAFQWQGVRPVFCDIDERTHNLDPAHAAELVNERTSAIVGVHLWGRPAYSEELDQLASKHGLTLLFDAAHAIGCSHGRRPVGGGGRAEVLSFHATKIVNTFEGGAVLTNDGRLAERLRKMRNFGFVGYDDVRHIGVNGKLPEMSAAMGINTLAALDDSIALNRRNHEQYRAELAGLPGISLLAYDARERHNYQYVVLEVDPGDSPVNRDDLMRLLHAENVLARRYFFPGCHRMEPYRSSDPDVRLPATDRVAKRVLIMPTGGAVTPDDISLICKLVSLAARHAEALPSPLPEVKRFEPPSWDGD
jgi:dTDP-4-amino-4,6-dideoxygalactose transaminase